MNTEEKIKKLAALRKERSQNSYLLELSSKILEGDRYALSKGITLLESSRPEDRVIGNNLIQQLAIPESENKSIRLGITGVPGVGKSTFIENFGKHLIDQGKKVAILAIDPSSTVSKGSILGDKTRMSELSKNKKAFIRPTASGGALGGVARATKESILLCEAAGYDVIIVETVGVGQSETTVREMVDFFMLLMLSGAGDELQGIKRGIMEMADALIINKADGDNLNDAKRARTEYAAALHLFPPRENGWTPKVDYCSALKNERIDKAWEIVTSFHQKMSHSGWWNENRKRQAVYWLNNTLKEGLMQSFLKTDKAQELIQTYQSKIMKGEISPFQAAELILKEITQ